MVGFRVDKLWIIGGSVTAKIDSSLRTSRPNPALFLSPQSFSRFHPHAHPISTVEFDLPWITPFLTHFSPCFFQIHRFCVKRSSSVEGQVYSSNPLLLSPPSPPPTKTPPIQHSFLHPFSTVKFTHSPKSSISIPNLSGMPRF